jgi:hypothetical protein
MERRQLRGKDGCITDTEYTIYEQPRKSPDIGQTTYPVTIHSSATNILFSIKQSFIILYMRIA